MVVPHSWVVYDRKPHQNGWWQELVLFQEPPIWSLKSMVQNLQNLVSFCLRHGTSVRISDTTPVGQKRGQQVKRFNGQQRRFGFSVASIVIPSAKTKYHGRGNQWRSPRSRHSDEQWAPWWTVWADVCDRRKPNVPSLSRFLENQCVGNVFLWILQQIKLTYTLGVYPSNVWRLWEIYFHG